MANILDEIVEQTRLDIARRKKKIARSDFNSFELYERTRRNFRAALSEDEDVAIIAEIKKASPSKGEIRSDFNPQHLAASYEKGGAAALSVLTDEPFFKGTLNYLQQASEAVQIPMLRKDFIVDPYQIEEARAYGADAILLIATILEGQQLAELHHAAEEADLQCLVECYNDEDMKYVNFNQISIIGVNNRDLKAFEVDLHRGVEMLQSCPDHLVKVSESGLGSAEDLHILYKARINAALIGEHFMRQEDPGLAVSNMRNKLAQLIETF